MTEEEYRNFEIRWGKGTQTGTHPTVMADIARQLTRIADGGLDEAIKVIRSESTPAPDALVEAVKKVIANTFISEHEGFFRVAKERIENLQKALDDAAHEKEKSHGR